MMPEPQCQAAVMVLLARVGDIVQRMERDPVTGDGEDGVWFVMPETDGCELRLAVGVLRCLLTPTLEPAGGVSPGEVPHR